MVEFERRSSPVGLIPRDWDLRTLNKVGTVEYGISDPLNKTLTDGVRIIGLQNVSQDGVFTDEPKIYVKPEQLKDDLLLKQGDILFCWRSGSPQHIGKTYRFELNNTYTHVGFLLRIRGNEEILDATYLDSYLKFIKNRGYFLGAKVQVNSTFNKGELLELPIVLPPLAEQKAIAQILGTWDEAIALTQSLIDALTRRKRALMQVLIPSEHNISDGWKVARLGDFITQDREYIRKVESKLYPRISVKWWAKGAVVAGYDHGDDVKMKRHQLAKTDQIIVSEIWAKHGSIGIIPEDGEGALITSHFYLFDVLDSAQQYQQYIHELVNANYFMIQADRMSQGSTGYASIRANDFLKFKIPVPPNGEETTIADILGTCDVLIKQYEMYLDKLQEQKRGLMQVLLTGQVRVGGD